MAIVTDTSILFSFTRVDNFFELMINREDITTSMMDGVTPNFKIILAEQCNDNVRDNLNADGTLDTTQVVVIAGESSDDGDCALLWNVGVNTDRAITMGSTAVNYDFGDESHMLKGAFLVCANSGVVLAYSINNVPIPLTTSFTAPVDGMIWSIRNQAYGG